MRTFVLGLLLGLASLPAAGQEFQPPQFDQPPMNYPPPPVPPAADQPRYFDLPGAALPSPAVPVAPAGQATAVVPAAAPKLWEGSLELGLNGSDGNSQTFNFRTGAKVKRKTEADALTGDFDYRQNSSNSIETANRAFLDWRFEHFFKPTPWTWFLHGTVEYDEFRQYDLLVSLDTGLGYQWLKNETTSLITRLGAGATDRIGGPDEGITPEAVFGIEGEHRLSKKHKLCASVEYRPDVTDFQNYRINAKADWEVLLDEAHHLSLKLGLLDRYDSEPGDSLANDIDYAATLLWSF